MLCCDGAAISKKIHEKNTSHSKIETYDESYCQDAIVRDVFNFSEPRKKYYENQDPWKSVAGEDRSGQLGKETDLIEASDHYYNEQFMESFSSTNYLKLDYDRAWSSQEWEAEATTHDRLGQLDKTSWRMVRQVRLDHEGHSSRRNRAIRKVRRNTS